jgi:hypothetical protein
MSFWDCLSLRFLERSFGLSEKTVGAVGFLGKEKGVVRMACLCPSLYDPRPISRGTAPPSKGLDPGVGVICWWPVAFRPARRRCWHCGYLLQPMYKVGEKMSGSLPTQAEALRRLQSLLAADPVAPSELAELYHRCW